MTREEKVTRARELREQGWSYKAIGAELGVHLSTARSWINPEIRREERRRDNARRHAAKLTWSNGHRAPCPICGSPMRSGSACPGTREQMCRTCFEAGESSRERRERIVAMWNEGRSLRDIARALDSTPESIGVDMVRLRAAGYHLPYRYTTGKRAGRKFPEAA